MTRDLIASLEGTFEREFLKLASLARWDDCSPGEVVLKKGQPVCDAIVLISGEMEAVLGSTTRMALRPGQLIGTAAPTAV
jgi:CRP-like cAMP-binding protein